MKVAILFTCYNRREKTINCINTILAAKNYCDSKNLPIELNWFITDAGSDDGTVEEIRRVLSAYNLDSHTAGLKNSDIHIFEGTNNLFYSNGMRKSMELYMESDKSDYILIINDDVKFYEDFLYKMIKDAESHKENTVIIGATDYNGTQTYGGIRYNNGVKRKSIMPQSVHYETVKTIEVDRHCHTFNANCVLIPDEVLRKSGIIDEKYEHSLGDFDLGLNIYEKGYGIISTAYYVGECKNNSKDGTWMDKSLSRSTRVKKLNSIKGAPTKYWFYYVKKHFGFMTALLHSISPYIRILLGK